VRFTRQKPIGMTVFAADMGGVVIPSAIMAFNTVVILAVVVVHRRRTRSVEETDPAGTELDAAPAELERWQRLHGHAVDAWMRDRERLIGAARAGERSVEEPDPMLLARADEAVATCPDDQLRSSLTSMRAGGEAAVIAFGRGRAGDGEEAFAAFQRHRDACAARMRALRVG